jgi:hypothetical protein
MSNAPDMPTPKPVNNASGTLTQRSVNNVPGTPTQRPVDNAPGPVPQTAIPRRLYEVDEGKIAELVKDFRDNCTEISPEEMRLRLNPEEITNAAEMQFSSRARKLEGRRKPLHARPDLASDAVKPGTRFWKHVRFICRHSLPCSCQTSASHPTLFPATASIDLLTTPTNGVVPRC